MKVKAENIIELLNQVAFYMDGIQEASRMGGDILENIEVQADEVKKLLIHFRALYLTEQEIDIAPDQQHSYLKTADTILSGPFKPAAELTHQQNIALIQAKVYAYLKRTIRERKDLPGIDAGAQDIFYYVDNLLYELPEYRQYEKTYYYSLQQVVTDIVNEITEHRKINRQTTLF